ncbi:MAG: hypothetical protein GY950_36425 [bacterium]|nr:hypothetical protein [bacterium]
MKYIRIKLCVLLFSIILTTSAVMGVNHDIVFVLIPASAEPPASGINSQLPSDRYVDGCQIVRLNLSDTRKKVVPLTSEFVSARDPEVSFDGQEILFAGKRRKGDSWQIWRMNRKGGNKQQITHGNSSAVSPLYIGSLFHLNDKAPTRKLLYTGIEGRLYTCDLDGGNWQRITFNLHTEFSPAVLPNGRVIFSSMKNGVFDLLAVNIDGTDLMGYVDGSVVPGNKEMVRIGGDGRVYFIETDVKRWLGGGRLSYVSRWRPSHSYGVLGDDGIFHSPCPMPDGSLIFSYRSKEKESLFRLYNQKFCRGPGGGFSKEPLGRRRQVFGVNGYHCVDAHVLALHPTVQGRSSFVEHKRETGIFYCIDVYISRLAGVKESARGSIKGVRVLEGVLDGGEPRILGTAPVEEDGSFHIEVPAKTPVAFQLLDKGGMVVGGQSTWTWVMPRESRGCIGCHEDRELAPPNKLSRAIIKPAVKLKKNKVSK